MARKTHSDWFFHWGHYGAHSRWPRGYLEAHALGVWAPAATRFPSPCLPKCVVVSCWKDSPAPNVPRSRPCPERRIFLQYSSHVTRSEVLSARSRLGEVQSNLGCTRPRTRSLSEESHRRGLDAFSHAVTSSCSGISGAESEACRRKRGKVGRVLFIV